MTISTLRTQVLASPFAGPLLGLAGQAWPLLVQLARLLQAFRAGEVTPAKACQFEKDLQTLLRQLGQVIVAWMYNRLEPDDDAQAPAQIDCAGLRYRRRERTKSRHGVGTLFGIIGLLRLRYEPLEPGLPCLFPLECRLGVTVARATPALAERVGVWSAQHPQQAVLDLLRQEHGVSWSVQTLRNVTAAVSVGMAPHRQATQVGQVLAWLRQAHDGRGPHRPVLVTGRDGIYVPLRASRDYHEAATATVSVLDRRGRRLGTVYLGYMPEPGQPTLSAQLTALLSDVLAGWQGPLPRLEYVTDGGYHQTEYFEQVLRCMAHPRTGKALAWEWVLDFYHACGYLSKLAEALFGAGTREAAAWARKMRHWLQFKKHGLFRVLHSAAAHHATWQLSAAEEEAYAKAYAYLRKRLAQADYAGCRRRGLAIGSGVTEAACKVLFTQRFKQAGMSWALESGQVIVDLRAVWLSGAWVAVHAAYLESLPQPQVATKELTAANTWQNAA